MSHRKSAQHVATRDLPVLGSAASIWRVSADLRVLWPPNATLEDVEAVLKEANTRVLEQVASSLDPASHEDTPVS